MPSQYVICRRKSLNLIGSRLTYLTEISSADWQTDRCVAISVGRHDNNTLLLNLSSLETYALASSTLHPPDHCTSSFVVTHL